MTEDTEEVILTRWEKLKNWADIFKATFTIGKILWGFLFVSAGAVVVGEVTDTTPVRDVAEYAGIVQPDTARASLLARIDALEEADEQKNAALERIIDHQHNYPDAEVITGPAGKDGTIGPPGKQGLTGAQGITGNTGPAGKDGIDGKDGINGIEGSSQIDDAFNRHKLDDH